MFLELIYHFYLTKIKLSTRFCFHVKAPLNGITLNFQQNSWLSLKSLIKKKKKKSAKNKNKYKIVQKPLQLNNDWLTLATR